MLRAQVYLRRRTSSWTGRPWFLKILTTLSVVPNGSGSSFCTRFSTPSPVFCDPGTKLFLSLAERSNAEYLDFDLRIMPYRLDLGASSSSEASLRSFSAGHSVGNAVDSW